MRVITTLLCGLLVLTAQAQKMEEGFDWNFKPTTGAARYYVITEKKDTLWQRKAYYLPEKTLAMEGAYKDKEAAIPHGQFTWYHASRFPREQGSYQNGRKEGAWLGYNEAGILIDSSWYDAGRLRGVHMGWYADGMPSDSAFFDGAGNGVRVYWREDGTLSAAGRIINDTAKIGRWQYFHRNGKLKASEDYVAGELTARNCFDEQGIALDSAACVEKDAAFPGAEQGWRRFLERNLDPSVPLRNRSPLGEFQVVVQFIVNEDGSLANIRPITSFGFGMEDEVVRIMKRSPKWIPAQYLGEKVKAYRRQPVTFTVVQE